jgi:uroporphyrin-III C-methyltransferase/precorrin-2 dehydrogenase/sirohydrochlorin ferrochelatase
MTYPLHLDLTGKRVLVVGAGAVAARRIDDLLEAGADVVVVAPLAIAPIAQLAESGRLAWRQREFAHSDVLGAWLVHATTNVPSVNAAIVEEARRRQVWAVRADEAVSGDARTPAVAVVGNVVVSVTTGDPRRSTELRDGIHDQLVDGRLAARPRRSRGRGSVVLIGGGPGDPDLITVRGRRELFEADVVVYDRLAPTSLLDLLSPSVELIDAGKSPGRQALSQEQINAVIVDRALAGRRVARLKGGDPFVLGRGSEEVLACAEAGVRVDVIPGISSAIAAPAAAGIPVTHRGVSAGFVVLSGHVVEDLSAVASTGLTAVVLMGVATLPRLVQEFIAAGRDRATPAAVIHKAFDADQRIVIGTLADIAQQVAIAGIENPSVIVIGDVVGVAPALAAEVLAS